MQLLVRGEVAALPLKGVIDLAAEKARLDKEIAKADADIKRVDAKLCNEKFVANAPEEVVEEETREARRSAERRKAKIARSAGAAEERRFADDRARSAARCFPDSRAIADFANGLLRNREPFNP